MNDYNLVKLVANTLIGKGGFGTTSEFDNISTFEGLSFSEFKQKFEWVDYIIDNLEFSIDEDFIFPRGIYESFKNPVDENIGREQNQECYIIWNDNIYHIEGYDEAEVSILDKNDIEELLDIISIKKNTLEKSLNALKKFMNQ